MAASFVTCLWQIDRCQQYALAEHFHWQMRKPVNSDKFETGDDLKLFEIKANEVFQDLKQTFVYKEDTSVPVCIFSTMRQRPSSNQR